MLTSSASTPYDWSLLIVLVVLAGVLFIGALSAPVWPVGLAMWVRRGAVGLAVVATAVVVFRTPTRDPFVSLGRFFTIWPALLVAVILYGVWAWRAGRW
jgi:hypothetical protein